MIETVNNSKIMKNTLDNRCQPKHVSVTIFTSNHQTMQNNFDLDARLCTRNNALFCHKLWHNEEQVEPEATEGISYVALAAVLAAWGGTLAILLCPLIFLGEGGEERRGDLLRWCLAGRRERREEEDSRTFTHSSFTHSVIYPPDIYPPRHLPTQTFNQPLIYPPPF